jgi:hypothetical protein
MFILTGTVGFRGSNGDRVHFPPDWLVRAGAGISNRASGRGRRASPRPHPAPLPSLGGIVGRDYERQRERIRFDRGCGKVRL